MAKTKSMTIMHPSLAQIKKMLEKGMHMACIWEGCERSYPLPPIGGKAPDMPPGWVSLITFQGRASNPLEDTVFDVVQGKCGPCIRDACLCPVHAEALEDCLKDIGGRLRETKGNA